MKKIHNTMIVGLMAGMVMLAGCKREYGTVTLGANIDNGRDAKVYIDNLTPCWHNNDLIRVNNQTCTTSAALGSSAQITDVVESNHYRAIYPADIVGDVDISSSSTIAVTLPREQIYEVDSRGDQKVKVPMGAYASSERLTFHNLCSLIKVVISSQLNYDFLLDSIRVTTANSYLSGLGSAIVEGRSSDAMEMMASASARHSVSLVFTPSNRPLISYGDRNTYTYYLIAPEFNNDAISITLFSPGGYVVTYEKSNVSLHHNRIATVSLTVDQLGGGVPTDPPSENGGLPGLFSVSETMQVHFSQGNLQYQASTNTWRFAEHQYDYVGDDTYGNVYENGTKCNNANISSTYSGWIDLFGWGTSGWNSGANCYQPWSTSQEASDYITGGSYNNSLTGAYAEADWAWHNAIDNGGNSSHMWRTLTQTEWAYLLRMRQGAYSKYGIGKIADVTGLIILPDSWTLPVGCTFTPGVLSDWTINNYTIPQWALMESAGAVFFPTSGFRAGVRIYHSSGSGTYYTATPYGTNPYVMYFSSSQLTVPGFGDSHIRTGREFGNLVRPVRDVE